MKNTDELTQLYAKAKGKTVDFATGEVKALLGKSVADLIAPKILDKAKAEMGMFDEAYSDLQKDVVEFAANINKQTQDKRKEVTTLKKDKTKIISSIATAYKEGGDGSQLYARLAEVDSKIQNIQSFLDVMDAQKDFPNSEVFIKKAQDVATIGKNLLKFYWAEFAPEAEKLFECQRNLTLLLQVAQSQLYNCQFSIWGDRKNRIVKAFGQANPELAVDLNPNELNDLFSKYFDEV